MKDSTYSLHMKLEGEGMLQKIFNIYPVSHKYMYMYMCTCACTHTCMYMKLYVRMHACTHIIIKDCFSFFIVVQANYNWSFTWSRSSSFIVNDAQTSIS